MSQAVTKTPINRYLQPQEFLMKLQSGTTAQIVSVIGRNE